MAFAIYASLIPFSFEPMPVELAFEQFATRISTPTLDRFSRTNFLANVLLFVPIGFGLAGAFLVDRRRRVGVVSGHVAIVLAASLLLSLTAEFLQMFAPGRVPARADVEAQMVGCVIGIAAWLAVGDALTTWLRTTASDSTTDRRGRVILLYTACWIAVNLAPLDLTLDLGELAQRVRAGAISLVPFGGMERPAPRIIWDALIAVISAVPLGALGLSRRPSAGRRVAPGLSFAIGAALVVAMEVAQIFIVSHAADITDVICGWLGVAIGVIIGRRLLAPSVAAGAQASSTRGWTAALLAAWCLVLVLYHWMPYDFTLDSASIRGKLDALSLVPFASYTSGSNLNALNDLLVKLGLAAPFGLIAAFVDGRHGRPVFGFATFVAIAILTFGMVEAGQLFIPSRWPDPTDVLVGVTAAVAGLWLGRWLRAID